MQNARMASSFPSKKPNPVAIKKENDTDTERKRGVETPTHIVQNLHVLCQLTQDVCWRTTTPTPTDAIGKTKCVKSDSPTPGMFARSKV